MERGKDLFRTTRRSRIPWIPHRFAFPGKNSATGLAPESVEFLENISPVGEEIIRGKGGRNAAKEEF